MFTRKALISSFGRAAALASVAALALTAFEPQAAQAGPATPAKGAYAATGTSGATDISAARRRYYRGGGGAAAAAAFAGIVGTGLAIAASQDRGYYGGPAYVAEPVGPECIWQRQRFWDGYGWRVRSVRVCD